MQVPVVSVVLPVYNQGSTLADAVESVLAQVLGDLELIVVDDASTDDSLDIAVGFAEQDDRVRLVRNTENSRRAAVPWESRNDGIAVAGGTYLAYLDADNTWRPTYLSRMVAALEARSDAVLAVARSCNHHPPDRFRAHLASDRRVPTALGPAWVVYGFDELRPSELGYSQYIDTNEMVHRARVFDDLPERWRSRHARSSWVQTNLGGICPWRRQNDLDLVERIIARYGVASVELVREVLVDYYYRGAPRRPRNHAPAHAAELVSQPHTGRRRVGAGIAARPALRAAVRPRPGHE